MKKYYVYELYNSLGTIEYVGESSRPYARFANHTKHKSTGKFCGRLDLSLHIVKEFNNRKDAFNLQCELQNEYGMIDDITKILKNQIQSVIHNSINIIATDKKSGNEYKFTSICKCAEFIGVGQGRISQILSPKYKRKSTKGFTFKRCIDPE